MQGYSYRRARRVRYVRVCQHCTGEIKTEQTFVNFYYSLLCRGCFLANAIPQQQETTGSVLLALVAGPVDGANVI